MDENLEYAREMLLGRMLDLFIDRFSILYDGWEPWGAFGYEAVPVYWLYWPIFNFFRIDENIENAREMLLGRMLDLFIDRFPIFQDG